MGTSHFSGLNLRHTRFLSTTGPTSEGVLTITGLAVDDVILDVNTQKVASAYTTARLTSTAYTISAANTITLKGTTAYSASVFDVLWLDMDKA